MEKSDKNIMISSRTERNSRAFGVKTTDRGVGSSPVPGFPDGVCGGSPYFGVSSGLPVSQTSDVNIGMSILQFIWLEFVSQFMSMLHFLTIF